MALHCSLPMFPGWRTSHRSQHGGPSYDKQALETAVRRNAAEAQRLSAAVQARLAEEAEITVDSTNKVLLQCTEQIFPGRVKQQDTRPWQTLPIRVSVLDLWQSRRSYLKAAHTMVRLVSPDTATCKASHNDSCSLISAAFGCWKAHFGLQKTYKELQRRGRAKRRQFLEDQLIKAKSASDRHDTKELYAIIRQLAPKRKHRAVRIRKMDGTPLNAEAEFVEIKEYFGALYSQDDNLQFSFNETAPTSGRVLITAQDVRMALKANKLGKTVPFEHAPTGTWLACADIPAITEVIADAATCCVNGERPILHRWSDCYLALIPKPNKSLCRPENLRPLGIQDVAGKSFACKSYRALQSGA